MINIRRFFDYRLAKQDILETRGKYIKNYVNAINNRRNSPKLKLLKEKLDSPVVKYQKFLVNQKGGKKYMDTGLVAEHDREILSIRNNYLRNSPTSLVFLKKCISDIFETGSFKETRSKVSGIWNNAKGSVRFFFGNFDIYKQQLKS
jgi:hypothetical protein